MLYKLHDRTRLTRLAVRARPRRRPSYPPGRSASGEGGRLAGSTTLSLSQSVVRLNMPVEMMKRYMGAVELGTTKTIWTQVGRTLWERVRFKRLLFPLDARNHSGHVLSSESGRREPIPSTNLLWIFYG